MKKIYLGAGCFWGVEYYFKHIKGILNTKVGYANGLENKQNPTYKEVCSSDYNFVEVCYLEYDENIISLKEILAHFFRLIDPFSINKQGNDVGSQYRTGLYYIESNDVKLIKEFINFKQSKFDKKIVVEVLPLNNFYLAEDYHQKYLEKNPNGYCHIEIGLSDIPLKEDELY